MKAVSRFSYITIDGVGYFEPEESMTYDEAIKWTKTRGLRLLTRGEWCDLWDHKEEFRKSCRGAVYWTASPHLNKENCAWYFISEHGIIGCDSKKFFGVVRAVLAEPDGPHNY
jgi:hypothetical protein